MNHMQKLLFRSLKKINKTEFLKKNEKKSYKKKT